MKKSLYVAISLLVFLFLFIPKVHASTILDTTQSEVSNNNCLDDDGNNVNCVLYRYYFDTGSGYPITSGNLLESITLKVDLISYVNPDYYNLNDYPSIKVQSTVTGGHLCKSRDITYGYLNSHNNSWTTVVFYCDLNNTVDFSKERLSIIFSSEGGINFHIALTTGDLVAPSGVPGGNFAASYCYIYQAMYCSENGSIMESDFWMKITDSPKVPTKTPVLIVPGIMGTEINKGTEKLWLDIDRLGKFSPMHSDDFMDPLAFKEDGAASDTTLSLGKVLDRPHPTFDYSEGLVTDFISKNYDLGKDLFLFPYDWRDDNAKNANNYLKTEVDNIIASSSMPKIDIIAHSQGGLVIKKLLFDHPEYLQKIDKLIFVGTPNLGAPKAAKILIYGDDLNIKKFGLGLDSLEVKKISQNMPAVYQLLPSREYFNHSPGYAGLYKYGLFTTGEIIPSFDLTSSTLNSLGLNSNQLDKAGMFHSSEFDNYSFSNPGPTVFNIMGCETPTINKIYVNGTGGSNDISYGPGDGTVPLISASNINGTQNMFVLKKEDIHSTMLTTDGVRQKLVNIITDNNAPVSNITTNPALCVYKGKKVDVHSPVDLHVYDEFGNHVGPTADGGFDNQINDVQYDIIGHDKYAFLPDGRNYTLKFVATDQGKFDFYSTTVSGSEELNIANYTDIPVANGAVAQIDLNETNDSSIQFVTENRTVDPVFLDTEQLSDSMAPTTTPKIIGDLGRDRFYSSNVKVELSANDAAQEGAAPSGVLNIFYKLDTNDYQAYSFLNPLVINSEGPHTVKFYSVDRMKNVENEQIINFTIDKTAPELIIQFNNDEKDLIFTGTDNMTSTDKLIKLDKDDAIRFTDQAGNYTQINLKDKDRKHSLKAEIKSISYNGKLAVIAKNNFNFHWSVDKKHNLTSLSQYVASKKDFNILAIYDGKNTKLTGKDAKGRILKTFKGLETIIVKTQNGDLDWSY